MKHHKFTKLMSHLIGKHNQLGLQSVEAIANKHAPEMLGALNHVINRGMVPSHDGLMLKKSNEDPKLGGGTITGAGKYTGGGVVTGGGLYTGGGNYSGGGNYTGGYMNHDMGVEHHKDMYHHLLSLSPAHWELYREKAARVLGAHPSPMWDHIEDHGSMEYESSPENYHHILRMPNNIAAARMVEAESGIRGSGFLNALKHVHRDIRKHFPALAHSRFPNLNPRIEAEKLHSYLKPIANSIVNLSQHEGKPIAPPQALSNVAGSFLGALKHHVPAAVGYAKDMLNRNKHIAKAVKEASKYTKDATNYAMKNIVPGASQILTGNVSQGAYNIASHVAPDVKQVAQQAIKEVGAGFNKGEMNEFYNPNHPTNNNKDMSIAQHIKGKNRSKPIEEHMAKQANQVGGAFQDYYHGKSMNIEHKYNELPPSKHSDYRGTSKAEPRPIAKPTDEVKSFHIINAKDLNQIHNYLQTLISEGKEFIISQANGKEHKNISPDNIVPGYTYYVFLKPNEPKPELPPEASQGGPEEIPGEDMFGPESIFHGGSMSDLHPSNIEGGGLKKIVSSAVNLFNPADYKRKHKQIQENLKRTQEMSAEEKTRAYLSAEAYKQKNKRLQNVHGYSYLAEHSGPEHAVYVNPKTQHHILSFKGTNSLKDVIPDIHIATGTQSKSSRFKNAVEKLKHLKEKLKGTWETTGHSLGATLAMYAAQKEGHTSHAFNPGFVSGADEDIDTQYKGHNIYLTKGDPFSNSILKRPISNLKVQEKASIFNPILNHSITSFLRGKTQEQTHQAHDAVPISPEQQTGQK